MPTATDNAAALVERLLRQRAALDARRRDASGWMRDLHLEAVEDS